MGKSLVVDTCVLLHATDNDQSGQTFLDCLSIAESILNNDKVRLAVDTDWEIMEEYERNLTGRKDHLAKALKEYIIDQTRIDQSKIVSYHIPIPDRRVEELADMGFHPSDIKFVKIGPRSDLEVIVSTDGQSFFEDDYKNWIEDNLDIDILTPNGCNDLLDDL